MVRRRRTTTFKQALRLYYMKVVMLPHEELLLICVYGDDLQIRFPALHHGRAEQPVEQPAEIGGRPSRRCFHFRLAGLEQSNMIGSCLRNQSNACGSVASTEHGLLASLEIHPYLTYVVKHKRHFRA